MRCANVVVGHDLTADGEALLEALTRREVAPARVHVVHVLARIDRGNPALVWSRDDDEPRRAHATSKLRAALGDGPWARADVHVVVGDPATRLVEIARAVDADLVAVGCHGRHGVERFLLGSVAEHVVRFAPCPVLVVPCACLSAPAAPAARAELDVDDAVEALGLEVLGLVERTAGYLTALQVGLPRGTDEADFDQGLTRWLAGAGVEFVDLAFTPTDDEAPRILRARFEPLPEDP